MKKIQTPAILLDLDTLEKNLKNFQQMADRGNKKLWPMLKTHKSIEIARMQLNYGAMGFLCGTLDECEAIYENFVRNEKRNIGIMYAYPVASEPNISRVIKLAAYCDFYLRIDNYKQAKLLNEAGMAAGVHINYAVIINSGLNRFGISYCELKNFMGKIADLKHLKFAGISTHPGHVYGKTDKEGVLEVARQESDIMTNAANILRSMGTQPQIVSSGSTPTYPHTISDAAICTLHPGNYVFMDNIQVSLECAKEDDCALTVLTTVISAPRDGELIIDAGSKCLGLDKGAHGNGKIQGHGRIKSLGKWDYNAFTVYSLSEEVGKIIVNGSNGGIANFKIGDRLEIIPNHSCSTANNTSYFVATRNGKFDRLIPVDMRSNSTTKGMS